MYGSLSNDFLLCIKVVRYTVNTCELLSFYLIGQFIFWLLYWWSIIIFPGLTKEHFAAKWLSWASSPNILLKKGKTFSLYQKTSNLYSCYWLCFATLAANCSVKAKTAWLQLNGSNRQEFQDACLHHSTTSESYLSGAFMHFSNHYSFPYCTYSTAKIFNLRSNEILLLTPHTYSMKSWEIFWKKRRVQYNY